MIITIIVSQRPLADLWLKAETFLTEKSNGYDQLTIEKIRGIWSQFLMKLISQIKFLHVEKEPLKFAFLPTCGFVAHLVVADQL